MNHDASSVPTVDSWEIPASGVMLLVTQYLQMVAGLSPLAAGLWMGPPALMMVLAGIVAPLLARRFRPAHVVGAALALSTLGYWLLAGVEVTATGVGMAIAGFSLVYFGLGTIAALGTDLVVGAAPAERTGSASAMSEMVQELRVALGVALLGSLATFVYRAQISEVMANGVAADVLLGAWRNDVQSYRGDRAETSRHALTDPVYGTIQRVCFSWQLADRGGASHDGC